MKQVKVLRRKDAHHIFFGWTALLARRTDVLEEAWLDTESQETSLEKTPAAPKAAPKPPSKAAPKSRRKKPFMRRDPAPLPGGVELDDVTAGLDDL